MKPHTSTFPLPTPAFSFAGFSWPRYVGNLPRGSKAKRLAEYKRPICGPYYHAPKPEQAGKGKGFYHESRCTPFRLRWQYCDEVSGSIRHTGWFSYDYQEDKFRGLVFRLPRSRGFLIGWTMGEGMASVLEGDIYDDERDAAHAADDLARQAADEERESRERDEAEQREAEEKAERDEIESALFCNA